MTPYFEALRNFKREYFLDALQAARGNQSTAADLIGVHRNTIHRLLKQAGLTGAEIRAAVYALESSQQRKPVQSAGAPRRSTHARNAA